LELGIIVLIVGVSSLATLCGSVTVLKRDEQQEEAWRYEA
jgi:hypothetical protein